MVRPSSSSFAFFVLGPKEKSKVKSSPGRPSSRCGGVREAPAGSFLLRYTFDSALSRGVPLVLHDLEAQVVERAAHLVEPVLGLDDNLVEALLDRPDFLLLGQRAEMPLAAPVAARAADPRVQHAPAVEVHVNRAAGAPDR